MISRRDDPALYARVHRLVRKVRGPARDQICEHCGRQALDWAQIHDKAGTDPQDYIPLCKSCHAKYDGINVGKTHSEEAKAKMQAKRIGTKHSPESKRKIGDFSRGKPKSPETRARMRESALRRWERVKGNADQSI